MTLCDTIDLLSTTEGTDADGYKTTEKTQRTTVRCDCGKGVTREEFYKAYKTGVELSAAFELWACDYSGQKQLEYHGTRFKVIRAYPLADGTIQLNCAEVIR